MSPPIAPATFTKACAAASARVSVRVSAPHVARRGRVVCLVQLCICQLIEQATLRLCAPAKEASCEMATWRAAAGHTQVRRRQGRV